MGEVILSVLVQVLLEKSTSHILHQYGKMWGCNVHREIKKLQSTLSAIQAVLQDAEEKQVKNEALKKWLADLKDAAYDAEDILDEFNYEVLRQRAEIRDRMKRKVWDFFSFRNPIIFRIRTINKIKEIVERLDDIAAEKSKFHLTEFGPVDRQNLIPERPETHSFVNESKTIGREDDKKKIMESLISRAGRSDVSILPIVGIGGLGKTTLAQLVYNEQTVAEHFVLRVWVCVSEDFDIKKIVRTIIELASQQKCEFSDMESLQRKLREVLGGKRFLLVLDDVWEENPQKWDGLKDLVTTGAEGSCIIVTTRNRTVVASIVGALDAYELKPLSEDECWSLFAGKAFAEGGAEMRPNLINIGKAIVKKCGGLPLAAKMLGCLMYRKMEEQEWRSVMESEIWELEDDNILPSLRLSYNDLRSDAKQCFAYCAIFPKDYEIEKEMLIQLWMASGFIPSNPEKEAELKGHEIFNELASRSFFQELEEIPYVIMIGQTCRMHDLIHDLAQSVIGNECYILDKPILDKPKSISDTALRHLSITTDDLEPSTMEKVHTFKKLRTLLLSDMWSEIDFSHFNWAKTKLRVLGLRRATFVALPSSKLHLKHLRYLDLSETDITTLPEAISSLLNLQTLNLSQTDITTLPEAISSLLNLQTLNLSGCDSFCQLPKGVTKMSSLRHLYLHGCYNLTSMPRGIGQLRCLRTLTMYPVGNEIGSGSIEELKDLCIGQMLELRGLQNVRSVAEAEAADLGSKQDLRFLILEWLMSDDESTEMNGEMVLEEGNTEKVLDALQAPQGLKFFMISHYPGKRFPTWLMCESMLRLNLVEIRLTDCVRCEHLPQLGQLPYLEILRIENLSSVKHMGEDDFYGSAGGDRCDVVFPSLRTLELDNMDDLEEWSGIEGRPSFPKLEELNIRRCPKLGNLLHDSLQHLPALKKLTLQGCGGMTALPELPHSLLDLDISSCHNISSFPEGLGRLTALLSLEIYNLPKLFSLPQGMEGLRALKTLTIDKCPNLISLPMGLQQLTALKKLSLEDCEGMTALPELPQSLLSLDISSCHNISSFPEGLGRLTAFTSLVIHDLPKLFSLPQGMEGLRALKKLSIRGCPNLISLPKGLQQRLPSLRSLLIIDCPELGSKCQIGGEYWALISCIPSMGHPIE